MRVPHKFLIMPMCTANVDEYVSVTADATWSVCGEAPLTTASTTDVMFTQSYESRDNGVSYEKVVTVALILFISCGAMATLMSFANRSRNNRHVRRRRRRNRRRQQLTNYTTHLGMSPAQTTDGRSSGAGSPFPNEPPPVYNSQPSAVVVDDVDGAFLQLESPPRYTEQDESPRGSQLAPSSVVSSGTGADGAVSASSGAEAAAAVRTETLPTAPVLENVASRDNAILSRCTDARANTTEAAATRYDKAT